MVGSPDPGFRRQVCKRLSGGFHTAYAGGVLTEFVMHEHLLTCSRKSENGRPSMAWSSSERAAALPTGLGLGLLHGGGQTRHSWHRAVRSLASSGYFALAFDMRGHGESDWATDGDYSVHALARDLECVLAEVRRPVAIVGASLGGLGGGPPTPLPRPVRGSPTRWYSSMSCCVRRSPAQTAFETS